MFDCSDLYIDGKEFVVRGRVVPLMEIFCLPRSLRQVRVEWVFIDIRGSLFRRPSLSRVSASSIHMDDAESNQINEGGEYTDLKDSQKPLHRES